MREEQAIIKLRAIAVVPLQSRTLQFRSITFTNGIAAIDSIIFWGLDSITISPLTSRWVDLDQVGFQASSL
jgi:hypothetical protein